MFSTSPRQSVHGTIVAQSWKISKYASMSHTSFHCRRTTSVGIAPK